MEDKNIPAEDMNTFDSNLCKLEELCGDSWTALKIFQQQLDYFQALQKQTLNDVSMVQSEISDILNQSIIELKKNVQQLSSTPTNDIMSLFKTEENIKASVHLRDNENLCNTQANEGYVKINSTSKRETSLSHLQTHINNVETKYVTKLTDQDYLKSLKKDAKYKDVLNFSCSENENMILSELEQQKDLLFPFKHDDEFWDMLKYKDNSTHFLDREQQTSQIWDIGLIESTSSGQRSPSISSPDCNQVMASISDMTAKYRGENNETYTVFDELEPDFPYLHEINLFLTKNAEDSSENVRCNKDKFHLDAICKKEKEELPVNRRLENGKTDVKQQFLILEEVQVAKVSDELALNMQDLEKSPCDLDHIETQKELSKNDNIKMMLEQLGVNTHRLVEENIRYKEQISKLTEDKNIIQLRLSKAEQYGDDCIREMKKVINNCEDLLNERKRIQDERNHLSVENHLMMKQLSELKSEKEQNQIELSTIIKEKNELAKLLKSNKTDFLLHTKEKRELELKLRDTEEENKAIKILKEQAEMRQQKLMETIQLLIKSKNDKLNLESAIKKCLAARKHPDYDCGQSCKRQEKLLSEIKELRAKNMILWTGLYRSGWRYQLLAKILVSLKEDNTFLKMELQEYIKKNLKLEANSRLYKEDKISPATNVQTLKSEMDTLKPDQLFQGNYANYTEPHTLNTTINRYTSKHYYKGQHHRQYGLIKEINDFQYKSDFGFEAKRKIVDIQKKSEKEESVYNNTIKHSFISVRRTTSLMEERRHTAQASTGVAEGHDETMSIHTLTHLKEIF